MLCRFHRIPERDGQTDGQKCYINVSMLTRDNKNISCRRETARRFVSLNILISHSRSFETMSVCRTVYEIFSVKEWCHLETGAMGRSRSLKMAPFDRSYTTFYWSAIVSITVCCTIFKLFDVE